MTDFNFGALGAAGTYGLTGTEIYRNFHAGTGDDGRGLSSAARSVKRLSDHYDRRVESITRLTGQMESAWQGAAAGAARRGAAPLAVEHARAQQDMNVAEQAMVSQIEVFDGAKSSVREVPPTPEKPGLWDNLTSLGGANRSYENQLNQVNAANDVNVAVMQTYEGETQTNADRMPITYGSLSPDHSSIGVREPIVWPPEPVDPPTPPGGDDSRGSTVPNQSRPPQELGTRPSGDPSGGTGPNQFDQPRQNEPPRNFPPQGPGPGQNPNPPPGVPPGGFPPGRGPGPGPGGRPGPGGGGRGPGGFGPRGGGGFGPGGGPGPGAAGARGGGGFGPGGGAAPAAAEGAAGRGGPGGGGAGGGGGRGAGMGGDRGQGGEEKQHNRPSFLVEPDPHETFGSDEVTAPPVIGE